MKTFSAFLNEETKNEPIYHNKKMAIETPTFSGHAHFKFQKELGKYGNHEYRVHYTGTTKHKSGSTAKVDPDVSSHRMIVHNGSDGKPFKHQMDGASAKSLKDVLVKRAPMLIGADDLK